MKANCLITENLSGVLDKINAATKAAGRPLGSVDLIAVSKTQSASAIDAAITAGQKIFGENRVKEAEKKWTYHLNIKKDIELHLIGALQSNKVKKALNIESMNKACNYIVGNQDFTSFSKANTQTFTNNCNVMLAKWETLNNEIVFTIKANRFLRNMVRAIAGTLLDVGLSKIEPNHVAKIIAAKDRSEAGTSLPSCGLFLISVKYPKNILI